MFKGLKERWKVNGLNLLLILVTFALGGRLCDYTGRKILAVLPIEKGVLWVVIYILLVTLIWPFAVLLVSIPLGQFGFFRRYIAKIFKRFGKGSTQQQASSSKEGNITSVNLSVNSLNSTGKTQIAIFASGAGSNAKKIITHFSSSKEVKVSLIVCNKPDAGVLQIAAQNNIPYLLIEKDRFFKADTYLPELQKNKIDFIVLAGFLWKIPAALIAAYPKKIVNIHPALLPKYGGKGMYGHFVHEAVIANNEKESGITIHYVDELYDHGAVIFQATCPVDPIDTLETLAQKIHALEHEHYPSIIAALIEKQKSS